MINQDPARAYDWHFWNNNESTTYFYAKYLTISSYYNKPMICIKDILLSLQTTYWITRLAGTFYYKMSIFNRHFNSHKILTRSF